MPPSRAKRINEYIRKYDALKGNGVLRDPEDAHFEARDEAKCCPICHKMIHPSNWSKHFILEHDDDEIPLHVVDGRLPLAVLELDGGTQSRANIDEDTVRDYAELMKDGVKLPAITVFYDGVKYWLADGFHRVHAARKAAIVDLEADIKQGTCRDAILHSCGANATHGLRRTRTDKNRQVERLLSDDEWSQWSDREIARRCKVSHEFVRKIRKSLTVNVDSDKRLYTDKHGNSSSMSTKNIGTRPALPDDTPDYLQEAVDAGAVAISDAKTVHDLLITAAEPVKQTVTALHITAPEKVDTLARLYASAGKPGSNGTFDEIVQTGGFTYGGDMGSWLDFKDASMSAITKALDTIRQHHAREAVASEPAPKTVVTVMQGGAVLKFTFDPQTDKWIDSDGVIVTHEWLDGAKALIG